MLETKWIVILLLLLVIFFSSLLKWKRQTTDKQKDFLPSVMTFVKILSSSILITALISIPFFDRPKNINYVVSAAGVVLALIGVVLNIFAARELVKIKFTMKGLGLPDRLITNGIYRTIRHPSSLGIIFLLTGWYLVWNAFYCIYFIVPTIIIGVYIENKYEEKYLEKTFGDEFRAYKKSVGMYFPKIYGKK
ncbi:MAG: isoprenylcysteine carboxylmethyltransferase family protein [Bacteroidota bacterium]